MLAILGVFLRDLGVSAVALISVAAKHRRPSICFSPRPE
jgi:hypothetical protein